jgi:hypothetical protein
MSQTEVEDRRRQKVTVLGRRNIESYFFDGELITALCEKHGKPELSAELITARAEELRKAHVSRARPVDDVKASAGPIMNRIKRTLSLTQCGNSVKDFMRITMAPLMSPETNVYQELRSAIFVSPLPE